MLTLICLTKTYNKGDFDAWLSYHLLHVDRIVILDNDSEVDLMPIIEREREKAKNYKHLAKPSTVEYYPIHGWPNQWKLFADILNGKTEIKFKPNEKVMFLDDDEYLFFHDITADSKWTNGGATYSPPSFDDIFDDEFKMLDSLLLPEYLMTDHKCPKRRTELYAISNQIMWIGRSAQGKAVIRWQPDAKYSFNKDKKELGHVPFINGIRMSDVTGSGVSKTTYGEQLWLHDEYFKSKGRIILLHFHIKSIADWEIKIKRGSAASKNEPGHNGSYDDNIKNDPKYPWNKQGFYKDCVGWWFPYFKNRLKQILMDEYVILPRMTNS